MIVYITCSNRKEAERIAKHLIKRKLSACINYFPVFSIYSWQGKIVRSKEYVILVKSLKNYFNKIKKEVRKIHSYKIPCIMKIDSDFNEEFDSFVRKNLK